MKNSKIWYHLVGICGSSMRGIASYLSESGNYVTGSDINKCQISDFQFPICVGHSIRNIDKNIDYIVYTSAVTPGSAGYIEIEEAKKLGIKILKRSELIGKLLHDQISIGVTGMHGKTTTSSMIAYILEKAGLKPSFLIGSEIRNIGKSYQKGESIVPIEKDDNYVFSPKRCVKDGKTNYFVVEACEYDRSFLDMKPLVGVITNIDREHLDYYKGGISEIKQAFKKFIKQLPKDGLLVVWQEDKYLMPLTKSAKCKVKRVSINKPWPGLKLKLPGRQYLLDATLAARVAHELGVSSKVIQKALNDFQGAARRFELLGEKNGVTIIDDYGHHPTEIVLTIASLKEKYPDKRKIIIFRPHQQQRTKILYNDFIKSFDGSDKIVITDVYLIAGREKETGENLAEKMAKDLKAKGIDTEYISGYDNVLSWMNKNLKKDDIVVMQGATDLYKVGKEYLR